VQVDSKFGFPKSRENREPEEMPVRIRLARHGTRNNPFYHIVAINQRLARNAKPLELLGVYDPTPRVTQRTSKSYPAMDAVSSEPEHGVPTKRVEWAVDRIKWWISQGAQPSDTVLKLLAMVCKKLNFVRYMIDDSFIV
jgi:small subunit ribosomal protein S16